jgi:tetratricopeptide (TPR) repeat protein
MPVELSERRYVKAVEFDPGSFAAVHHANIKVDRTRLSRNLDKAESGPGYEGGGSRQAGFPDGHFLGWTPGQSAHVEADGAAWRLDPDSDLVVEAHLMPTGRPENILIRVGFYFTDRPPDRLPYVLRLGRQDIDIPPGEREYVTTDSFTLPVDVEVLAVQPHAHYLARNIRGFATLPDGTTKWLIFIANWDFHWQDIYRLEQPLSLPKGTTLTMKYTYDNSTVNPRNPNHPPRRVTYGQTTSSEMGSLWVQVATHSARERQDLDATFSPKLLQDDIAGYELIRQITPRDARLRVALGYAYLEAGRLNDAAAELAEAVRLEPTPDNRYALATVLLQDQKLTEAAEQFSEALRLKPDSPETLYGLGVVRQKQGLLDDAITLYRRALQVDLHYADAYYNLGRALAAQGRTGEAIIEFRHGLSLNPDDAEAHRSLATSLASTNLIAEAVTEYRKALALVPDLQGALLDLAWILATSDAPGIRNAPEAIRLAERVSELTEHKNPSVLDTLAAAYAAGGEIDLAISTADSALQLATRAGDAELAHRIQQRLEFYLRSRR